MLASQLLLNIQKLILVSMEDRKCYHDFGKLLRYKLTLASYCNISQGLLFMLTTLFYFIEPLNNI